MAISKQTAVRHLSYEEMDMMLRELAEQIRSKGIKVTSISPRDQNDYVATTILAHFLGANVGAGGYKFSLYSEADVDFCLFNKNYDSNFYNSITKCYVDTINVDNEMRHTRITLPWMK